MEKEGIVSKSWSSWNKIKEKVIIKIWERIKKTKKSEIKIKIITIVKKEIRLI